MTLAYLHGFASGPGSTKAQFFRARLAELGATLEIPDLAPDFTHLTVTGILAIVEAVIAREFAEAHGGAIRAESQDGGGATFVLRFPREGPADQALQPTPRGRLEGAQ